ncbi:tyrosine-type recombinase/integrase [Nissabacter archeti]|jgi:integrase|uniref:tyrosine-type recombinase/integrase n=1 Tax=Nissabacter archeti TaxID=1917880 RepID=UPI000933F990|nr:site-specific integrase [Nissabacter archeti]
MRSDFDLAKAAENCSAETIAFLQTVIESPLDQLEDFSDSDPVFRKAFMLFTRLSLLVTRRRPELGVHCILIHVLPKIGDLPLSKITKVVVNRLTNPLIVEGKIVQGKRVFSIMKQFLAWCVFQGYLENSPVGDIPLNKVGGSNPKPRERTLTDAEIWVFWHVWDYFEVCEVTRWAARLTLAAARRPDEILRAKSAEFDLTNNIWNQGRRNKSNRDHRLPISPIMKLCIERLLAAGEGSEWLCPSNKKAGRPMSKVAISQSLRRILETPEMLALEPFTPRDLRRTARSCLASLDVPSDVSRKVLNQSLEGIDRVYDRHDYIDQMQEALYKYSVFLFNIVESEGVEDLSHKYKGDRLDLSNSRLGLGVVNFRLRQVSS